MRFFVSINPARWTRKDVLVVMVVPAVVTALAISADLLATPVVRDTGVIVGKVPTSSLKGGDRCLVGVRDGVGVLQATYYGGCPAALKVGERVTFLKRTGRISGFAGIMYGSLRARAP